MAPGLDIRWEGTRREKIGAVEGVSPGAAASAIYGARSKWGMALGSSAWFWEKAPTYKETLLYKPSER
jgi:hypothetical protein